MYLKIKHKVINFQILAFAYFAVAAIDAEAKADPYYYYHSSYNPYYPNLGYGYGYVGYPYYTGRYPNYAGGYPYYGYSASFPINTIQGRENSEIDLTFIPTVYGGKEENEETREIKKGEPQTVTPTFNKLPESEETAHGAKIDDAFINEWAAYGAYGYDGYGYTNAYPNFLYATNPYAYAFHY